MSPICMRAILRFMKTAYRKPSGCSNTKTFRSSPGCWSTTAEACAPKIAEVVAGARAFVRSSNPEDRMFVVNFNETVSLGLPDATGFTANADELESAIWRAPAAGETALYDAIVKALERFEEARPGQEGAGGHQRRRR